MPTGTKLVAGLAFLALALGVVSWWYRFEAAHRSTEFWGPTAAELIARPSQVTASTLVPLTDDSSNSHQEILSVGQRRFLVTDVHEVTDVPGMVHLRNSLLTDSNYDWTTEVKTPRWRWCLRFANEGQEVRLLFSEEFGVVGLLDNQPFRGVNCSPMGETLGEYFANSNLFDASKPSE